MRSISYGREGGGKACRAETKGRGFRRWGKSPWGLPPWSEGKGRGIGPFLFQMQKDLPVVSGRLRTSQEVMDEAEEKSAWGAASKIVVNPQRPFGLDAQME